MKAILTVLLLQAMPYTAQMNYDKAYEYLVNGRAHTASIYIERSLQRQQTLEATLLKVKIEYDMNNNLSALQAYNKARQMGDVPSFVCITKGDYCPIKYYDWYVLNVKINKL
jgi:ribosomal protein L31E